MPPFGGFGATTGVADVHNLSWKLSLVLNNFADPSLLDTYSIYPLSIFVLFIIIF